MEHKPLHSSCIACCPPEGLQIEATDNVVEMSTTIPYTSFSVALNAQAGVTLRSNVALPVVPFNFLLSGNTDEAFNLSTGQYTVPRTGSYRFDYRVTFLTTTPPNITIAFQYITISVVRNLSPVSSATFSLNITDNLGFPIQESVSSYYEDNFMVGDVIALRAFSPYNATIQGSGVTPGVAPFLTIFSGTALFTPATTALTIPTYKFAAVLDSPTSPLYVVQGAGFGPSVQTIIPFNHILFGDDVNSFQTLLGTYTVPASGMYRFDFSVAFSINDKTLPGNNLVVSLQTFKLQINLTTSTLTFQQGSIIPLTENTVTGNYVGLFTARDLVCVAALWVGSPNTLPTILGPVNSGLPPWRSIFSGQSCF